jgi:hypothetical protein
MRMVIAATWFMKVGLVHAGNSVGWLSACKHSPCGQPATITGPAVGGILHEPSSGCRTGGAETSADLGCANWHGRGSANPSSHWKVLFHGDAANRARNLGFAGVRRWGSKPVPGRDTAYTGARAVERPIRGPIRQVVQNKCLKVEYARDLQKGPFSGG